MQGTLVPSLLLSNWDSGLVGAKLASLMNARSLLPLALTDTVFGATRERGGRERERESCFPPLPPFHEARGTPRLVVKRSLLKSSGRNERGGGGGGDGRKKEGRMKGDLQENFLIEI